MPDALSFSPPCLRGDIARLRIPEDCTPERTDQLWEHTCFEAFFAAHGESAYREFNFSPSGQWAAYAFKDYRQAEDQVPVIAPPTITTRRFAGRGALLDQLVEFVEYQPPEEPDEPDQREELPGARTLALRSGPGCGKSGLMAVLSDALYERGHLLLTQFCGVDGGANNLFNIAKYLSWQLLSRLGLPQELKYRGSDMTDAEWAAEPARRGITREEWWELAASDADMGALPEGDEEPQAKPQTAVQYSRAHTPVAEELERLMRVIRRFAADETWIATLVQRENEWICHGLG